MKADAAQHRRGRSPTKKVTFQQQDSEAQTLKEEREIDQSTENKVCGACFMYTNTETYSQTTAQTALMKTENQVQVSSAASLSEMNPLPPFKECSVKRLLKFYEIPDVRVLL